MKRALTIACTCLGAGALLIPAAASQAGHGGGHGNGEQAKACAKLKKADRAAFRATWGPKKAMRNCIRGDEPDATEVTPAEFKNAAKECRAERTEDPDAFRETYGTNEDGRNAFGKCVSSKVRADDEPEPAPEG